MRVAGVGDTGPSEGRRRGPGWGRALVALGLLLGLADCGATEVRRERALLELHVEPPEARIRVDDRFIASGRVAAARPIELTPGQHQLSVEAAGYFPHDLELDLPVGTTTVEIHLRPVPP